MKYNIYQITKDHRDLMFESYKRAPKPIKKENYALVYSGEISGDPMDTLDALFCTFNMDRPADFKGHSMSVSDVVELDGFAYYVDSMGFRPLDIFETEERS